MHKGSVLARPCWELTNIVPRLVIKQFFSSNFFFYFSSFLHFFFPYYHSFHVSKFHISGPSFFIMIFLIWEENGTTYVRFCNTMLALYHKELKQRKHMNVAPSLNNEFQIQVCWKGKDFGFQSWSFDLRRKMVLVAWDLGKASHEGPTFLHSWFGYISRSHNGLQCEIFDNRRDGGLKLHSKHIKNHDWFLRLATLQTCQNNIITSTVVILVKP
jgi:hypothetical protein